MKKIFRYLKPYSFMAIISPLLMIGEVTADLILPYLMSVIVDCGITGEKTIADSKLASTVMRLLFGAGPYDTMSLIITFGIMMLAVVLIGGFFGTFCAYTAAKASQGLGNDLRCDVYKKVMSLSIEQTDKFTTGSLVTRMTNDISMIIEFVEMILRMFVRSPMFFIGGAIALLSLDVTFGAVILCALPVLAVMLVLILRKATPMYNIVQKKLDRVNSVVQENVNGARVVKAYVREDYEYNRFENANAELKDINYKVLKLMAVMQPILTVIMNTAIIAVLAIGGFRIDLGLGMTTGTIMAAITYVTQVLMSVMMVTRLFQSVSRSIASAKRIVEVLESDPVIVGGEKYAGSADSDICISYKNVGFSYPGTVGAPVLHDINLDIKRGEMIAVIGATGSGKSSLVKLIPRFYDPTEGEIFIDGIPIKDYDLTKLRKKIGFVMQKSELFSDTISNNIKWGDPDASEDKVKAAADVAKASDFIEGFADKYDTFIAEKGASLSGGQKQRMSIARAIIRKPEIMILDDSTSALDLATESKLRKGLRGSLCGSTIIMIAQRIASVKEADRIAVIENGTIIACAPHDELMKSCPTYIDIYNSQIKSNDGMIGGEVIE